MFPLLLGLGGLFAVAAGCAVVGLVIRGVARVVYRLAGWSPDPDSELSWKRGSESTVIPVMPALWWGGLALAVFVGLPSAALSLGMVIMGTLEL